jgi:hypothetical protein
MAKTLKARVLRGRYEEQTVRISNVEHDESGRPRARVRAGKLAEAQCVDSDE